MAFNYVNQVMESTSHTICGCRVTGISYRNMLGTGPAIKGSWLQKKPGPVHDPTWVQS